MINRDRQRDRQTNRHVPIYVHTFVWGICCLRTKYAMNFDAINKQGIRLLKKFSVGLTLREAFSYKC